MAEVELKLTRCHLTWTRNLTPDFPGTLFDVTTHQVGSSLPAVAAVVDKDICRVGQATQGLPTKTGASYLQRAETISVQPVHPSPRNELEIPPHLPPTQQILPGPSDKAQKRYCGSHVAYWRLCAIPTKPRTNSLGPEHRPQCGYPTIPDYTPDIYFWCSPSRLRSVGCGSHAGNRRHRRRRPRCLISTHVRPPTTQRHSPGSPEIRTSSKERSIGSGSRGKEEKSG